MTTAASAIQAWSGGHHAEVQADFERMEWELEMPFEAYDFQKEAFGNLASLPSSALYHEPGLGKTFTSAVTALHKRMFEGCDAVVVVMPPILIANWARFLASLTRRGGLKLAVLRYEGTPKQRKEMKLTGHDFVLMSIDIFKRDFDRIASEFQSRFVHLIVDEATSIKNIDTKNYGCVKEFAAGNTLQLLTGTPLNKPLDAYAYIKLIAPTVYRNYSQFERIHVSDYDFFGKPAGYANLEMLRNNMLINADRRLKEEVLKDLPPAIISAQHYALDPKHLKLYRKLAEDQLLVLSDGRKIDATIASRLFHNLGQIICNWQHFDPDQGSDAKAFELVQQLLDELGDGKLVVFANYKMTNRRILEHFKHVNAVGVWGDVSPKDKQRALDAFTGDPACRLITLQPSSAGLGIDGLQHVCSNVFYFEPPGTPALLDQSLSRLYRSGQRYSVNVRIGVAEGTLQVRQVSDLVDNKELVDYLQGSATDLRAAIFGD